MHQSTFSTSHDVGSFEFFWMGHSNANLHAYLACLGQWASAFHPLRMIERIPFNVASMTQRHTQIHAWGGSFTQLLHPSFRCTCRWRLQQLLKPKQLLPKQPLKPSQSGDTDSLKRAKVTMSSFQIVCWLCTVDIYVSHLTVRRKHQVLIF